MASTSLVKVGIVMQPHGNLTASYLWQPGEFARRMLGDRPSPVPPTRELWPAAPQQPLSISTLHIAYLQDEPLPKRAATLPCQSYSETIAESDYSKPRVCTVGTNTEPPPTIFKRFRLLLKRQENDHVKTIEASYPPPGRLTAVPKETTFEVKEEENSARRAINGIKKAITGVKYRVAPETGSVESPKIVYNVAKPGDRMATTFGAESGRFSWCKMPSGATCSKRLREFRDWCRRRPRRPPRRQNHLPRLQITQV